MPETRRARSWTILRRPGPSCLRQSARRWKPCARPRSDSKIFENLCGMGKRAAMRSDGRHADQLRSLKITPDFISQAEGSVLIELGKTRVISTATVADGVPGFLKGSGKGWVTSEYGMLPRATEERTPREASRGKQSGRTLEIQRLIGRSLRAVTDQEA